MLKTTIKTETILGIAKLQFRQDGSIKNASFSANEYTSAAVKSLPALSSVNGRSLNEAYLDANILASEYLMYIDIIKQSIKLQSRTLYASLFDDGRVKELVVEFYFNNI